jgi:endonuclease/exonuclease/phosphatase family metal-dependent hydrolase
MIIRVVTYNIHRGKGMDGRVKPARIAEVLREIDADVIALQEVVCGADRGGEADQGRFLADALGFNYQLGENRKLKGAAYGNVALSRFPLKVVTNHDLSVEGYERRGALHTDVALTETEVLHVFNIHLGTAFLERRHQARRLSARSTGLLHNAELKGPKIVLGDFNEWTQGLATQMLGSHLKSVDIRKYLGRSKTYPAYLPILHLDHIYYDGPLELKALRLHRTRKALMASDHLPLVAEFEHTGLAERDARPAPPPAAS